MSQDAEKTVRERSHSLYIHEWLDIHAKNAPTHLAVLFQENEMDYARLRLVSTQIAYFLKGKIRPGDPVVVVMERAPLLIAVMMGIFKAGGIFVPVNPKYPNEKIRFIINDCQTRLILTDNFQRIPEEALYQTILVHSAMDSRAVLPEINALHDHKAIACIIYTSESTRGVMIRHASLMNMAEWYQKTFLISHRDRSSQFASQGFDAFLCETIPFLFVGASIHIIDKSTRLAPSEFFHWVIKSRITFCHLPTLYAKVLFAFGWPDNHFLQTVILGGERLTHYPSQTYHFDLWNTYGRTETCFIATSVCLARSGQSMTDCHAAHAVPPIGKPVTHIECFVVDKNLQPVPQGQTGELLVGGKGLSPGYLNRPDLTRKKFIQHPFNEDPDARVFRTGDSVRWHPDGNLEFLGRMRNQIKIQGVHIKLNEVESCLTGYPDISEAVVLAKETDDGKKSLVAWLVPKIEKIRIPWQEKCLIALKEADYLQAVTENISREGIAISGLTEEIPLHQSVRINLALPGSDDSHWLSGKIVWQHGGKAGIHLDTAPQQKKLMEKCLDYYLSTHNLMETLENASVHRSLQNALKKKLPGHLIPDAFCLLPRLPLTFNGKVDVKSLPYPLQLHQLLAGDPVEPRTETEKKLAVIWKKTLHKTDINLKKNFFEMGGTSLQASEFCLRVSEEFDVTLPPTIFIDRPYLPIIAEFIDSKGEQYTRMSPLQKQIAQDSVLPDDLAAGSTGHSSRTRPGNILLVGTDGFLGPWVLKYLLKQTAATIYCLIKKSGFTSALQHLKKQLEQCCLTQEISLENPRIVVVPGDITRSHFNLPMRDYEELAESIDAIFHTGSEINTMASYNTLRSRNVTGTREIIQFAMFGKEKGIHYISSFSAATRKNEEGHYAEIFPGESPEGLSGGYALTKWVSERLLTQIMQRGLPVHLYRLGTVLGDRDNGVTTTNSALLLLIKGCIQMGLAPDWDETVAVLPVDFVAKAIIALFAVYPEKSAVYHIEHPTGIPWLELIRWFQKKGYHLETVSHEKWLQRLNSLDRNNALFPVLPYYLSMTVPPCTTLPATQKTQQTLKKLGLAWPEINDTLLETYFDSLAQTGFLSSPVIDRSTV